MATSPISQSPILSIAGNIFATIFIGFGLKATIDPTNALDFFKFEPPSSDLDKKVVDSLMVLYGARAIFMGLSIYLASWFGNRKSFGWTLIAASGVAFVDGAVCWSHGKGEWDHWRYAPVLTVVGTLVLGVLDRS